MNTEALKVRYIYDEDEFSKSLQIVYLFESVILVVIMRFRGNKMRVLFRIRKTYR